MQKTCPLLPAQLMGGGKEFQERNSWLTGCPGRRSGAAAGKCWSAAGKGGILAVERGQLRIHKEMLGLGEVLINWSEVRGHPCWKRERGSGLGQKFIYPALWAAGRNQIPAPPLVMKKVKSDRFHKKPFPPQSLNLSIVTEPLPSSFFLFIKTGDQFFSDTTTLSRAGSIIHEHENSGIRKKTCHKFSYLSF